MRALLPFLGAVAVFAQNDCTICADGSKPVGNFGPQTCEEYEELVKMTPANDSLCLELQVEAYKTCTCPTLPEGHCQLCEYPAGYVALEYPGLQIPNTSLTCEQAEFREFSNGCSQDPAIRWFCGCPNITERPNSCGLCDGVKDRLLPPEFTKTCSTLDREGGLLEDCSTLTENIPTGLNYIGYCGCNGDAAGSCKICGDDPLLNPNLRIEGTSMRCADLENLAGYADADYCLELQGNYEEMCCQPTQAPVPNPTPLPSLPPSTTQVKSTSGASATCGTGAVVMLIAFIMTYNY